MDSIFERQIRSHESSGRLIEIKKLQLGDVPQIREIARGSFSKLWEPRDYSHFLNHPCGFCYGLFQKTSARGSCLLICYLLGLLVQNELDIISVATKSDCRRQGYARELLQSLLPRVKKVSLEVEVNNKPAINLYEAFGLEVMSKRERYYDQSSDAYVMARSQT